MTDVDLVKMFKDLEDESWALEKTVLIFIEHLRQIPEIISHIKEVPEHCDMGYKRWQSIAQTDIQKAFLSVRRAISDQKIALEPRSDDDYDDDDWKKPPIGKN